MVARVPYCDHESVPDDRSALDRVRLHAFDLTERTTRAGYQSLQRRVARWRSRGFLIAQCAVTAGLAWWLAIELLHHQAPFFAPVAAILVLNVTYGNRLRRGVEVAIGVALGVFVGDVFVHLFGTGVWQIMVVVALAMSLASLVGAGQLMTIQAAVQSIIVITLLPVPSQAFGRWLDAVVGCALALLVATIAPSAPLRKPGILAAQLLQEMAGVLRAVVDALRHGDPAAADQVLERARDGVAQLKALQDAADEGLAVVRHSPFRHGQLGAARAYAELIDPLDRASRNLRVLARRGLVAVWRAEPVPESYLQLLETVADQAERMAGDLHEGKLPVAARKQLVVAAQESSHLPVADSISAVVILAQARSMLVDLMELTGLSYVDARVLVPDMD
jgi:uncharacterized membrane protein YgaE (UPF0421/DUF939 family)